MTLRPQKRARPLGMSGTPFDPLAGTFLPIGETHPFAEFTVVAEGHDLVYCTDREGRGALIAKPVATRKSTYDGLSIGGVTYTSTGIGARTAVDDAAVEDDEAQLITPDYEVGEKIMAFRRNERDRVLAVVEEGEIEGVPAGDHLLDWEDCTPGRRWAVLPP